MRQYQYTVLNSFFISNWFFKVMKSTYVWVTHYDTLMVMVIRMFHRTTICRGDNHTGKNFVPPISGESSQIDGLEAGKITFKDC